jgi:hypothetical protein
MNDHIGLWTYRKAPQQLRQMVDAKAKWVALIPKDLVSSGVEALFLRWSTEAHPVDRYVLADGSILFAGSFPSAETMMASPSLSHPDQRRFKSEPTRASRP